MKIVKLDRQAQFKILGRFIEAKRKAGVSGNAILQTMPELGVWLGPDFYSVSYIVKSLNQKLKHERIELI